MQAVTKFELLSNEIFVECFEYLSAFDIYYSFHRLNYRCEKLIRSIPLKINVKQVRKTIFDQLCNRMFSNSEIKKQIYSLRSSNEDTYDQIQVFLSIFLLDEFPSLRLLTLTDVDSSNFHRLKSMLPLLFK
ncbi:unnamed protein product, partial [Rotaria sordida]